MPVRAKPILRFAQRGSSSVTSDERKRSEGKPRFFFFGRNDRIRTCDILVPNQARYQLRYIPNLIVSNSVRILVPNQARYGLRYIPNCYMQRYDYSRLFAFCQAGKRIYFILAWRLWGKCRSAFYKDGKRRNSREIRTLGMPLVRFLLARSIVEPQSSVWIECSGRPTFR